MPSLLLLRRRLRSVRSTRKITRAMELVAAAKMKRAIESVVASRTYAENISGMLERLAPLIPTPAHPLLRVAPKLRHATIIVFSSDRGLCGSFNAGVAEAAMKTATRLREEAPSVTIDLVTMGKKGRDTLARFALPPAADFPRPHRHAVSTDTAALRHLVIDDFLNERTDRVLIVTTRFLSALNQRPSSTTLLPLASPTPLKNARTETDDKSLKQFEPSREAVLDTLLPRAVDLLLYQALLDSVAAEHAARRMTMKNATDAAKDVIDDLLLTVNQTRQATITREMAEITTAMGAMNN